MEPTQPSPAPGHAPDPAGEHVPWRILARQVIHLTAANAVERLTHRLGTVRILRRVTRRTGQRALCCFVGHEPLPARDGLVVCAFCFHPTTRKVAPNMASL